MQARRNTSRKDFGIVGQNSYQKYHCSKISGIRARNEVAKPRQKNTPTLGGKMIPGVTEIFSTHPKLNRKKVGVFTILILGPVHWTKLSEMYDFKKKKTPGGQNSAAVNLTPTGRVLMTDWHTPSLHDGQKTRLIPSPPTLALRECTVGGVLRPAASRRTPRPGEVELGPELGVHPVGEVGRHGGAGV